MFPNICMGGVSVHRAACCLLWVLSLHAFEGVLPADFLQLYRSGGHLCSHRTILPLRTFPDPRSKKGLFQFF